MSNTNSWSSKEWFNESKKHFQNVKSCLPKAEPQTGFNFVLTAAAAGAYKYDLLVANIPGKLTNAAVNGVVKNTAGKVFDSIGNREAKVTASPTIYTHSGEYACRLKDQDDKGSLSTTLYLKSQNDNYHLRYEGNNLNEPEQGEYLALCQEEPGKNVVMKNNQTKDWQTVAQWTDKASTAAVHLGTGAGLYALSNGVTTAANSLLEGKSYGESVGNGLHAFKSTLGNACYGIGEAVAAGVDLGVGTTLLAGEGLGWVCGKAWEYTFGQLPHDEVPVAGEVSEAQDA